MTSLDPDQYNCELAYAFLRGRFDAQDATHAELLLRAKLEEVRIHRFKRRESLPRVSRVLSTLEALAPASLLDIGSGRGAFLWPLILQFPELPVSVVDALEHRVRDIDAVRLGGYENLDARVGDVCDLPFEDEAFDVVTVLEVLEHLNEPARAVAEVMRIANRFVVASVPSHTDDNPEHIQLFTAASLTALFEAAGAERVTISYVHNHMIAVVR